MATVEPGGHDVGVTGVDHVEHVERCYLELERVLTRVVRCLANRPWTEARARPIGHTLIDRRTDDGDVRRAQHECRIVDMGAQKRHRPDMGRQLGRQVGAVVAVPAVHPGEVGEACSWT